MWSLFPFKMTLSAAAINISVLSHLCIFLGLLLNDGLLAVCLLINWCSSNNWSAQNKNKVLMLGMAYTNTVYFGLKLTAEILFQITYKSYYASMWDNIIDIQPWLGQTQGFPLNIHSLFCKSYIQSTSTWSFKANFSTKSLDLLFDSLLPSFMKIVMKNTSLALRKLWILKKIRPTQQLLLNWKVFLFHKIGPHE